jgi:hypothetical protein
MKKLVFLFLLTVLSVAGMAQSSLMFWTANTAYGNIRVYVNDRYVGTITHAYRSAPDCGARGCVTVTIRGQHNTWRAEAEDGSRWSSERASLRKGCNRLRLYGTANYHAPQAVSTPSGSSSGNSSDNSSDNSLGAALGTALGNALFNAGKSHVQTPPHAVSTRTWTFGNQVWSDAIGIPACNKESFTDSEYTPDCRSYSSGSDTWYYYNWPYVNANKRTLCPPPWRVPTRNDLEIMIGYNPADTVCNEWEFSGNYWEGKMFEVGKSGHIWTTTPRERGKGLVNVLFYDNNIMFPVGSGDKSGFSVRCVR